MEEMEVALWHHGYGTTIVVSPNILPLSPWLGCLDQRRLLWSSSYGVQLSTRISLLLLYLTVNCTGTSSDQLRQYFHYPSIQKLLSPRHCVKSWALKRTSFIYLADRMKLTMRSLPLGRSDTVMDGRFLLVSPRSQGTTLLVKYQGRLHRNEGHLGLLHGLPPNIRLRKNIQLASHQEDSRRVGLSQTPQPFRTMLALSLK